MAHFPFRLAPLGLALPLALLACGASKDADGGGVFTNDSGVDGDNNSGDSSNPGDDSSIPFGDTGPGLGDTGPGGNGDGNTIGDGCAGSSTTAQLIPLDMYLMIDRSGSMTEQTGASGTGASKWDTLKSALASFIADPSAAGLGVGEAFFAYVPPGVPSTCKTTTDCTAAGGTCNPIKGCAFGDGSGGFYPCNTAADCPLPGDKCQTFGLCSKNSNYVCPTTGQACGTDPSTGQDLGTCQSGGTCSNEYSCTVADYSKPVVAISALPGNASALNSAIGAISPEGNTPTGPALQGAVNYAEGYLKTNPTHKVVVVLATDGVPTICSPTDIPSIAKIASDAKAAGVETFVIGIYVSADGSLSNLNQISQAGNGSDAIIINASSSADAGKALIDALNKIRGAALSCQYQVPTGADTDYNKVNVNFTPAGGSAQTIPYVGSASACGSTGGWYYDVDPSKGTPTQILVCPSTCTTFGGGGSGSKVDIVVGCQTVGIH